MFSKLLAWLDRKKEGAFKTERAVFSIGNREREGKIKLIKIVCPYCGHNKAFKRASGGIKCTRCKKDII